MRVRVSHLAVEAVRAMGARPVWTGFAVVTAIAVGLACGLVVVVDARALDARAARLARQGWGLVTVHSTSGGTLDPKACRAAGDVDGVHRVGVVGRAREVTALGLQAGLALTPVTPDAVDIVWPGGVGGDAVAGRFTPGFVAVSGLGGGSLHVIDHGVVTVLPGRAVVGAGRYPALDGGVLLLTAEPTQVGHCLVEVAGERAEELALDIAAAAVSFDVVVVPVLSAHEASPTPEEMAHDHRSRNGSLLLVAFLAIIGVLRLVRSRRDRAVYRLLSLGRGDLWLMGALDYTICLAVPVASAFAATVLRAEGQGVDTERLGVADAALLTGASLVVALGYATLFAAGRNRHQFAQGA